MLCALTPDHALCAQRSLTVPVQVEQLFGTWLHSREEDTPTQTVYRPADYDFPPARLGRTGYELKADGSCNALGVAAQDGWSRQSCRWTLRQGDPAEIVLTFPDGRRQVLHIASFDKGTLIIQK